MFSNCECECDYICRRKVKNARFVAIRCVFFQASSSKYSKIRFRPGLRPEPRWGSLRRSPDLLVGWGGGHPLPIPFPLWRLRRLDLDALHGRLRFSRLSAPNTNFWLRLCLCPTRNRSPLSRNLRTWWMHVGMTWSLKVIEILQMVKDHSE